MFLLEEADATVEVEEDGVWEGVSDVGPSCYPRGTGIVIDTENTPIYTSAQARAFAAAVLNAADRLDALDA